MDRSYALTLAHLAALAQSRVEVELRAADLRIEDWRVLDQLARESAPQPMSVLAEAVLLTGPTLTRTVDKLVSRAYVYRTPGDQDRRKVLISLSARGRELHERLRDQVGEAEVAALRSDAADVELRHLASRLLAP